MENTICLDKNYSTTRLITKEIPEIVASPEDKFETVLFLPEGEGRKGEGGLRTKGYFKKSFDDKPLISIVTVVYNGEKYLEETIESVINQTYDNVEYIIIDGGSTDGTRDIIKKYEDKIDYWVSERDKGIYDAMNKGILLSRGHWLNFMNAGDIFVNDNILKEINFESYENFALVYGNKIQNEKIIKPYNIKVLQYGIIMGNHQSMFFNKNILNNDLVYILEYSIYADYELVNKIYLKNYLIKYIDKNIANYEGGGISSVVSLQKRKDKYKIVLKNYGLIGVLKTILYRILKW